MGQKYAQADASGSIIALFDDAINSGTQIGTATKITDAQWQDILANPGKWLLVAGVLQLVPALTTAQLLAKAQIAQIALINQGCQNALAAIVASYPTLEIATFPNQYSEAQAYTANNTAPTPTLSAIATATGQTVTVVAASVLAKAAAYTAASGAAIGRRQALTTQINAALTVAAVQAIIW